MCRRRNAYIAATMQLEISAALVAPATMIRSSFEQRASSIIGSIIRSPAGVKRDWTMTAPLISTTEFPGEGREWLRGSCQAALTGGRGVSRLAAHIELENVGNHDHSLWLIPVLEHREFYRLGAVHEHAAAKTALILDNPVAAVANVRVGAYEFERDVRPSS
jgi:hypothetical protein